MLAGHIDEIGLMVTYIDDKGLLYFSGIGGWDAQQLVGQRVRILGHKTELLGVVGKKPIHLLKPDDRSKASKIEDMCWTSARKVPTRCVNTCASATWRSSSSRTWNS